MIQNTEATRENIDKFSYLKLTHLQNQSMRQMTKQGNRFTTPITDTDRANSPNA